MAATMERRMWDLLLILTAAPHSSDVVTSALRLSQAVLDNGGSVRVWACGYATMMTQDTFGETKLPNTRDPEGHYPSPSAIVQRMIADGRGRFAWIGCTACTEERGATHHIPQVRHRSPLRLAATVAGARRTLYLGGA
jgi:sulfur relay (sulfurtransferase) complex TusBCD TusD component (DsrE family)